MKALSYRMNRATFGLMLALLVVASAVMINTMKRPPGAEVILLFLLVPRLHDIGWSGWWALLLLVGEFGAIAFGSFAGGADGILIAVGLFVIATVVCLILLSFIPGQPETNRWGDPLPPGIHWKRPKATSKPSLESVFE